MRQTVLKHWLRSILPHSLQAHLEFRHAARGGDRELELIPFLVERSETSVDVGAYRGTYTWHLAQRSLKVYAVEPRVEPASLLRKRFGKRVQVLSCALSDREGTMTLWVPSRSGRDFGTRSSLEASANLEFDRQPIEVAVRTLDSLNLTDVGFVKVHVEGHELSVLRGAGRTLERHRPTILTAAQVRLVADLPARIAEFMAPLGYHGFFAEGDRLRPFTYFDPAVHQRIENAQWGNRAFIYNFLYFHPTRYRILERLAQVLTVEEPPAAFSSLVGQKEAT